VTALSIHGYAYVSDRYDLLPCGASMGDGYGPVLVARRPLSREEVRRATVAVPGDRTSAALALRLWEPAARTVAVPFDRIQEEVLSGAVECGILIHEGQLTYGDEGLVKIVDFGEWWKGETGLPLPLGGNGIRRDLPPEVLREASRAIAASIRRGLDHRDEALDHALRFGRGLDRSQGDRFVRMYVNDWTLDYGEAGRKAVQLFLDRGFEAGAIPRRVRAEFAS